VSAGAFKATAFKLHFKSGLRSRLVMLQNILKPLVAALTIMLVGTDAFCGNQIWSQSSPSSLPSGFVGADYTHDDGGALVILCDTSKNLISYLLIDPRAHWQKGTPVSLTTKADDGSQSGPTAAFVLGPTKLIVGEQSTWDISTMGKASAFFGMGDGVYARIFPAANFRQATAPVLQACGDHW
jgi:hypothetical protein